MIFDISSIVELLVVVVKNALPIGIVFYLTEMLVSMFLRFAFPRRYNLDR